MDQPEALLKCFVSEAVLLTGVKKTINGVQLYIWTLILCPRKIIGSIRGKQEYSKEMVKKVASF